MKTHVQQYDLAKQKFSRTLAKLYHQYEKILEENLNLHKLIEDLKKGTVLKNQKSKKVEKENIEPLCSTKKEEVIDEEKDADTSSKKLDPVDTSFADESNIPEVISLEFNSDSEPTPSRQAIKPKEKLITSPVITKSRRRRKKTLLDNKSAVDSDVNESTELSHLEIPDDDFEDAMCKVTNNLESSGKPKKPPPEPNESMCEDIFATTDDEIEIISKPKICQKLALNKSNVGDVEISQGRKLVQSKLILQKVKQKPESIFTLEDENCSTNWNSQKNRAEVEKKTENPETEVIVGTPMRTFKSKPSLSLTKSRRSLFESMISSTDDDKEQKDTKVPNDEYFVVPNALPGPSNQSVKRKLSDKNVPEENSSINDETFFSPGEQNRLKQTKLDNESCDNEEFFTSPECDSLLGKEKDVTVMKELPYVEKAVRGKEARAQLEGWDCWECEKFYKGMGYSEEEMKKFKKNCSRHRSKFNQRIYTPEGFWDPVFQNKYTQGES